MVRLALLLGLCLIASQASGLNLRGVRKQVPPNEQALYQQLEALGAQNGGVNEGHSQQVPEMTAAMNLLAADPNVNTICETGFNAGHGSLRWLLHSKPTAKVFSFDLGVHTYGPPAAKFLGEKFPGRILVTWGDSTVTVPQFAAQHPEIKCDLIYVDGGHDLAVAQADLKNFMPMANPVHNVVLIDDTPCGSAFCQGPYMAWQQMVQGGLITQVNAQMLAGGTRGFTIGKYNLQGTTTPLPAVATTTLVAR